MRDFPGVLLFTSHDHELVNTVANRIIELTPTGIIDKMMPYDDYLADTKISQLQEELYA
jgi:ATPase subunit of ABC transporter with duplicated ATPase domains